MNPPRGSRAKDSKPGAFPRPPQALRSAGPTAGTPWSRLIFQASPQRPVPTPSTSKPSGVWGALCPTTPRTPGGTPAIGPAARCLRRESRWLILGTPPMSRAGRNQKRSALAARSELAIVTISGAGGAYCSRNKRVARRCWHTANSPLDCL